MADPIGIRQNNPGNLRFGAGFDGEEEGDSGFGAYPSPVAGGTALIKNLVAYDTKHGLNTVQGIVARWAPRNENDTTAYINAVSGDLGVGPGDMLNMKDPGTLAKLATASGGMEWVNNAYNSVIASMDDAGTIKGNQYLTNAGSTFSADGNVNGTVWGGWLSNYIANQINGRLDVGTWNSNWPNAVQRADANVYKMSWDGGAGHLNFTVNGTLVGFVASDRNAKRNIQPTTADSLERIVATDFVSFDYKDSDYLPKAHIDVGVIAQDVQAINPNWVNVPADPTQYLGLNTDWMLMDALHAVKQLEARVAALEAQLSVTN